MTPSTAIKQLILLRDADFTSAPKDHILSLDEAGIEARYRDLVDEDAHWDAMNEIREGEVETGLPCAWSRHYESKSVAAKTIDGSWFGGGKHGEPEAIDWIDDAYALNYAEEEKTVVVQTFTKTDAQ
jgi:hypothetical protein